MSEYQYYEFVAVDRPLDERQLAELRALSTRARITPTSFVNTYHWGDFRGSPRKLVEEYFDAFLYLANWNTRELMIRLPRKLLDIETAARYCPTDAAGAWVAGDHVIVSLTSEEEAEFDEGGEGWLGSIIPIRAELAAGDLRALYLAWLLCAQAGDLDDDDLEPPVPPNMARLTASLSSLVDFLHLDEDLVAVAAAGSREAGPGPDSDEDLVRYIEDLPAQEKNALLLRAVRGDGAHLRAELLRRVRAGAIGSAATGDGQRTVAELLAAADARRGERERRVEEQQAQERARREREAAIAYEKGVDALALREDATWQQVDGLIEAKKAAEYDQAVRLLKDLRALGTRSGTVAAFDQRMRHLRERHVRKVSLLERLSRAGL
jgi:hypothetical protein